MCHLQASDLVECVDSTPTVGASKTMPEAGRFYTIESVRAASGGFGVRLTELTPECHKGGACVCGECGWDSNRFRKIGPGDPRLAIFRAMLDAPAETEKLV